MSDVLYRHGFDADDFLALARLVWPREYSTEEAAAALARTINIGAWADTVASAPRRQYSIEWR